MGGGKEFKVATTAFFRRFNRSRTPGLAPGPGPDLFTTANRNEDQDAAFAAGGIASVDDVASIASVDVVDNTSAATLDNKDSFVEITTKDAEAKTLLDGKTGDALPTFEEKIEAIKAVKRFRIDDDLVLDTLTYANGIQTANRLLRSRVAMPGNTILNPENREAVKVITDALNNQDQMCRLLANLAINIKQVKRILHDGEEDKQPEQ